MDNTNKIILGAIAVIIIIIGIIYVYTQPGNNPYSTPSPSPSVTASPSPTAKFSITPSPSPTQSPGISPTPSVKASVTPKASSTPTRTPTPTPTPKIDTFNISAGEYKYSPNSITAKSGDTVVINFTNNGTVSHNLAFQGQSINVATQTVDPGQTGTIQFTASTAGTYIFFCSVNSHQELGLQGSLIVQ